ncbi:hypothetical protein ONS95_010820 [Cadophora gregata]|uniref:uncharacterized protein n=1 Tax=Cadophora gregata TaxID=51156 RepID=UPI0026DB4E08|nr:uncharacterized protein ONS95_010820 [Cadophora gregata]KAK0119369.1 hypothetical protein ONS95_010820 [Cadophora gregata]
MVDDIDAKPVLPRRINYNRIIVPSALSPVAGPFNPNTEKIRTVAISPYFGFVGKRQRELIKIHKTPADPKIAMHKPLAHL